jgi:hypothetical protein
MRDTVRGGVPVNTGAPTTLHRLGTPDHGNPAGDSCRLPVVVVMSHAAFRNVA